MASILSPFISFKSCIILFFLIFTKKIGGDFSFPCYWNSFQHFSPSSSFSWAVSTRGLSGADKVYFYSGTEGTFYSLSMTELQWKSTSASYGTIPDQLNDKGVYDSTRSIIYFFGAKTYANSLLWTFNLVTNAWNKLSPGGIIPEQLQNPKLVPMHDFNLPFSFFVVLPNFYSYDQENNNWQKLPFSGVNDLPSCEGREVDWAFFFKNIFSNYGSIYSLTKCSQEQTTYYFQSFNLKNFSAQNLSLPEAFSQNKISLTIAALTSNSVIAVFTDHCNGTKCNMYWFDLITGSWRVKPYTFLRVSELTGILSSALVETSNHFLYFIYYQGNFQTIRIMYLLEGFDIWREITINRMIPDGRASFGAWTFGKTLTIFGGYSFINSTNVITNSMLEYQSDFDIWLIPFSIGQIPSPRLVSASDTNTNKNVAYLYGGRNGSLLSPDKCFDDFYSVTRERGLYNWTLLNPFTTGDRPDLKYPGSFCYPQLEYIGMIGREFLFLLGGCVQCKNQTRFSVFSLNLQTLVWEDLTNNLTGNIPPLGLWGFTTDSSGFLIYMYGGVSNMVASRTLYCLDVISLKFTAIQPSLQSEVVPPALIGANLISWFDYLILYGGLTSLSGYTSSSLFLLNVENNTWKELSRPNNPTGALFGTLLPVTNGITGLPAVATFGGFVPLAKGRNDEIFSQNPILPELIVSVLDLCPSGTILVDPNFDCVPCPSGTYRTTVVNNNTCLPCDAGTFSNTIGATSCGSSCPNGYYSDQLGQTSNSTCKPCPIGSYMDPSTSKASSISYCTLCPAGTFGGEFNKCTPCNSSEICGVGSTGPSEIPQLQVTEIPPYSSSQNQSTYQLFILIISVIGLFIFLLLFNFIFIKQSSKIQQLLARFDAFPVIPDKLEGTKIKYRTPFGGILFICVTLFLIGWISISLVKYISYNSRVTRSLDSNIPSYILSKSVYFNIYSIGTNDLCIQSNQSNACSSTIQVLLDDAPLDANCSLSAQNGKTCQIYGSMKLESLISATLKLIHTPSYSYNQGWVWTVTIPNSGDGEDKEMNFLSQSGGRSIPVPDNTTNVFHGNRSTSDVLIMTNWIFSSSLHPSNNFQSVALNASGQPIFGSYETAFDCFSKEGGVSFTLKILFNGYTISVQETPEISFLELLVTLFSVGGGTLAVGRWKTITEFLVKLYRLRNQDQKQEQKEKKASKSKVNDSSENEERRELLAVSYDED